MKMKKILAGALALTTVMSTAVLPNSDVISPLFEKTITARAAESYGDFEYTVLDDGTVEISDYTGTSTETELEIPSMIDGKKVTSIGGGAFFHDYNPINFKSIIIPDGVKSIEHQAFSGCKLLEKIYIPNSITYIGVGAFANCKLKTINIPKNLTVKKRYIFWLLF